jgi:hypothetical protein
MPYVMVFAAGFVVGKSWDVLKGVVAPVLTDASERFDALYARTARTVAQTVENAEDRLAERRYQIGSNLTN